MLVKVQYKHVAAKDWHAWLDENSPGWSIKGYEWHGDAASSEQPTRDHAEWLYDQVIKYHSVNEEVTLAAIYDINRESAMMARLTWMISPIRSDEDDQP